MAQEWSVCERRANQRPSDYTDFRWEVVAVHWGEQKSGGSHMGKVHLRVIRWGHSDPRVTGADLEF